MFRFNSQPSSPFMASATSSQTVNMISIFWSKICPVHSQASFVAHRFFDRVRVDVASLTRPCGVSQTDDNDFCSRLCSIQAAARCAIPTLIPRRTPPIDTRNNSRLPSQRVSNTRLLFDLHFVFHFHGKRSR